jgi:putative ABC transport system permease protein
MRALLAFFSWRHARRRPLRVLLGAAAIALGVVLVVSMDVANATVARAFARTVDDLSGKAEWQVTRAGGLGVDAAALERLRGVEGAFFAPVVQRSLALDDATLLVLGVDFVRDSPLRMYRFEGAPGDVASAAGAALVPGSIVVTRAFAERRGLRPGARLAVEGPRGRAELLVSGVLAADGPARVFGGNFALMQLGAAQELFGLQGRFDRIDAAGAPRAALEAALGPDYSVRPVPRTSPAVDEALLRIRAMGAISAIALMVGLFIIYNSVSISVVERVREIGILRSVGATRRQILGAIVLEWALVGAAGSVAGVALGYALARGLVAMTARSVNMLVPAVDVTEIALAWPGALAALCIGTLTAAGAALVPGLEAIGLAPVVLLRQGTYRMRALARYPRSFATGVGVVVAAGLFLLLAPVRQPTPVLLAATTVAFFALALCGPQVTVWLARATRPWLRRSARVEGYLAADNVGQAPQRTALTVVAFGGAVAMMVSSAALVAAFERSGGRWMEEAFPFDFSLSRTDLSASIYGTGSYGEELIDEVRGVAGVEQVYGVKSAFLPFRGTEIMLIAVDLEGFFAMHRARGGGLLPPEDPAATAAMLAGESVLVSENLAWLQDLAPGDALDLPTPDGPRRFAVQAEIEDYSWPAGAVLIDRGVYKRVFGDDTISYTDVRAVPGRVEEAKAGIAQLVRDRGTFFLYEVKDLQQVGHDTLQKAMALAHVQVLIAMAIGFLGIVNTLLISVLRRTREIGLLRAVGATRAQVRRTIVLEAWVTAMLGALFGVGAGLVGAAVPIRMFAQRVTGFWVPFVTPWPTIWLALGASMVLGLLASWLPARRAGRLNVLDAIAYE